MDTSTTTNNKTNTKVEPTEFEIEVVALLNQLAKGETDVYKAGKAFMRLNRVYHTKNEQPTNTERTVDEVVGEFERLINEEIEVEHGGFVNPYYAERYANTGYDMELIFKRFKEILLAERKQAEEEKAELVREILEVIPETVPYLTGDQDNMKKAVKAIATRNNIQV